MSRRRVSFPRLSARASRAELKAIAKRAGYHIQLESEIPSSIRKEIQRCLRDTAGFTLFNVTSKEGTNWNCIDDTLSAELEYSKKKPFHEVLFFAFMRTLFDFASPDDALFIYTEGAETGWFPLERRASSLVDFLGILYEDRDRAGNDPCGVYRIVGQV